MDKNFLHLVKMHNEKSRYAVLRGGSRSGKTYAALRFLILHAIKGSFKIASVVSESVPHLRRGAMRDFMNLVKDIEPYLQIQQSVREWRFPSGAMIEFFSADDSSRLRGAQRDWLFINEVNLITKEEFTELDIRTAEKVIVDFNPVAKFWLYELLEEMQYDISKIECVTTYKDNIYLSKTQIEAIEKRAKYTEWFKVYGLGEWGNSEGVAWYAWEIGDVRSGMWDAVGVDFGEGRSPHAVVGVRRTSENNVLEVKELAYGVISLQDLAQILKGINASIIVGDPAQTDFINLLRKENIDIRGARKMHLVANYALLNSKHCIVDRNSKNLINEAYQVTWADRGKGLLKAGVPDHAMDAMRYAINALESLI